MGATGIDLQQLPECNGGLPEADLRGSFLEELTDFADQLARDCEFLGLRVTVCVGLEAD